MRSFGLFLTACSLLTISAALDTHQVSKFEAQKVMFNKSVKIWWFQDEADRLIVLQRNIGQGKSMKNAAERNLQIFHAAFHDIQEKFDSFFDALICSAPEKLREMYDEMEKLIQKVSVLFKSKATY